MHGKIGRGNEGIAAAGRKAAGEKADHTRARIEAAKKKIERDIEKNDGLYPFAKGKLTVAEVLRRAGLSPASLQKAHHLEMREDLKTWIAERQAKLQRGVKSIRRAVTERVDAAKEDVKMLMQRYAEAELDYAARDREIADLKEKVKVLEAENTRLKNATAGSNVVAIDKGRR